MTAYPKVPNGFKAMKPRGQFMLDNGPIYSQANAVGNVKRYGFLPQAKHCNSLNFVHGGMIATLLDSAMAQTVADKYGYSLITISLNLNYDHLVSINRWAIADVSLETIDNEYVAANANLTSRNMVCVKAKGVFKLLLNRPLK